ncbi:MAG: hypothetical protein ABIH11_00865 [Candidatus Altiarchaeota archaeon]
MAALMSPAPADPRQQAGIDDRQTQRVLRIVFVQGPHTSEREALALKDAIGRADVFSPEYNFGSESGLRQVEDSYRRMFGLLAEGKNAEFDGRRDLERSREMAHGTCPRFVNTQDDLIYEARTPVLYVERFSDEEARRYARMQHQTMALARDSIVSFISGDFNGALNNTLQQVSMEAMLEMAREDNIIRNAQQAIPRILEHYPMLARKSELTYVVSLGSTHTRPGEELSRLQSDRFRVEVLNEHADVLPTTRTELIRGIKTGGVPQLDDVAEQLGRCVLEDLTKMFVPKDHPLQESYLAKELTLKAMASRVPLDDIRGLCRTLGEGGREGSASTDKLKELLNGVYARNGVEVDLDFNVTQVNRMLQTSYPSFGERYRI